MRTDRKRKKKPFLLHFSDSQCSKLHLITSMISGVPENQSVLRTDSGTVNNPNHPSPPMVVQVELDSEVRDNLLSECSGLSGLVDWLDTIDRRPGLSELDIHLRGMDLNIGALRDCIGYADDGYQRNVIKKTEFYELVAICWTPGQNTPIHDHVGSDCAFLIADGVSTETIYQLNDEGLAYPVEVRTYQPGEVCAADEPDIHRVSNDSDSELINVHVYTPPLHAYSLYEPASE